MVSSRRSSHKRKSSVESDNVEMTKGSPTSENTNDDKQWKLQEAPTAHGARNPMTPRTLAFNTLDRQVPMRNQQGAE